MKELGKLQAGRKAEEAGGLSCRGRLARASRGSPAHDSAQDFESTARAVEFQSTGNSPPTEFRNSDPTSQSQRDCPLGGELKSASKRGRDALGTRGRDVRDTKQNQSRPLAGNPKYEARNPKHRELKKQSQSAPALMGASSFVRKDYDDRPCSDMTENKANQSQFRDPGSVIHVGQNSGG